MTEHDEQMWADYDHYMNTGEPSGYFDDEYEEDEYEEEWEEEYEEEEEPQKRVIVPTKPKEPVEPTKHSPCLLCKIFSRLKQMLKNLLQ